MKKIPTLFKRDFSNGGKITHEYADGVDWVLRGEGVPTRKYDGTSVLIRGHKMYKRYEVKPGKVTPTDFEEADFDQETGKRVGWVQVGWGSDDKWHREAINGSDPDMVNLPDGTYELVGPKVQGNPEHEPIHLLIAHSRADVLYPTPPTDYDGLAEYLKGKDIEGIVWHHPDGRMAKIKAKDFGLRRHPAPAS